MCYAEYEGLLCCRTQELLVQPWNVGEFPPAGDKKRRAPEWRPPSGNRSNEDYILTLLSSMLSPCAGTSCFTMTCGEAFCTYIICSPSPLFTLTL